MEETQQTLAGVELGGTKCLATLATADGRIIDQHCIATDAPGVTIHRLVGAIADWRAQHDIGAVGIASFGPLDLNRTSSGFGRIVSTPKPGWSDVDVYTPFAAQGVPVLLDTDVNAAALAEGTWGAARGLDGFAYVTVGTGIGVGIINHGATIGGLGHPEAGHSRVPRLSGDSWPGSCPYHGDCAEGLASGPAIAARHGPGSIADDWPGWVTVENTLAMLFHNLVVTTQCRQILVGGGVAEGRPWLFGKVRARLLESLAGYYTASMINADANFIRPPGLGANAGPLGSIALALGAHSAARACLSPA